MKLSDAICQLRPGAEWTMHNEDYSTLQWHSTDSTPPTLNELNDCIAGYSYRDKRAAIYPSIGDQLDALWKGGDAAQAMHDTVMAVKAKYPKP